MAESRSVPGSGKSTGSFGRSTGLEDQHAAGQPGARSRTEHGRRGASKAVAARSTAANPTAGHGPRLRTYGSAAAAAASTTASGDSAGCAPSCEARARGDGARPVGAGRSRARAAASGRRTGAARAEPGDDRGEQDGGACLRARAGTAARELRRDREERQGGEWARAAVRAASRSPVRASRQLRTVQADGEDCVDGREPERDVRERERTPTASANSESRPWGCRAERDAGDARPAGQCADRTGASPRPSRPRVPSAPPAAAGRVTSSRLRRDRPAAAAYARLAAALLRQGAELLRQSRRRTGRRCGLATSAPATVSSTWRGRSGRRDSSGGAPCWMRRDVSVRSPPQNGCSPASASQSSTPTAQTSAAAVAVSPLQALGRDVGERARDVAEAGQRVELGHLGESEVEQAHVDLARLREQDVRRLHVAVDDPAAVRVSESLGDLCGHLERAPASSSAPLRIASRSVRPGMYS